MGCDRELYQSQQDIFSIKEKKEEKQHLESISDLVFTFSNSTF